MWFRLGILFSLLYLFSGCTEKGTTQPVGMGTTEEESGLAVNPGSSNSGTEEDSNSVVIVDRPSSSSQGTGSLPASSSSEFAPSNTPGSSAVEDTSSFVPFNPPSPGEKVSTTMYWDGSDTEGRVEVGSPVETAGYWYYYDDQDLLGGGSRVEFPAGAEENSYGNFFGPISEAYGGIQARVTIDDAIEDGFAGIGFNVWSESLEGADVSRWEGICLTYSSTVPFKLMLVSAISSEKQFVDVPASAEMNDVSFDWNAFKPVSAADSAAEDGEIFRRNVAAVWLQFQESGDFFITKIASLKSCE